MTPKAQGQSRGTLDACQVMFDPTSDLRMKGDVFGREGTRSGLLGSSHAHIHAPFTSEGKIILLITMTL